MRNFNLRKFKKAFLLLTVVAIAAASMVGCNGKNKTVKHVEVGELPLDTDVTLTCWTNLNSNVSSVTDNYGNTPFAKELEKRTGVKIEYIHPVAGQQNEALSLMIASDDLPDIISTNWINYQGGPSMAINEGVIIDIAQYKEYCPNYFSYLEANPDIDKMVKTDDGEYFGFANINDGKKLLAVLGPAVRKDWLDDLGMALPETIDDWTAMLTAFKEEKGATAPLSLNYETYKSVFFSLFEARFDPYIKDGKVVYGPSQPEFKKALEILHDWFDKGLLDNNLFSVDKAAIDSQILNGKTGATVCNGGSGIGLYQETGVKNDPDFEFVAVNYPTFERGKVSSSAKINSYVEGNAFAITTACQYPEMACKVLDYLYSEEGRLLSNFGVEGETFNYVDGKPVYSELITKNPDGLAMSQALGQYVLAGGGGGAPFIQDESYIEQYYRLPQQQSCFTTWAANVDGAIAQTVPPITPTKEEASEYSRIMNEVQKYRNQMWIKFINGSEPLSKFDEYVETMNEYGLDRAMEIRNAALKRYNER